MSTPPEHRRSPKKSALSLLLVSLCLTVPHLAQANDDGKAVGKTMADQVREALDSEGLAKKRLTLIVNGKPVPMPANNRAASGAPKPRAVTQKSSDPKASRDYIQAKAAELTGHDPVMAMAEAKSAHPPENAKPGHPSHWSYEGETGPQAWSKINPDFGTCSTGDRQSPIDIDDSMTLNGPAESLQFHYKPSNGTVTNNGHTIQVDVQGDNWLTVRGSEFKLLQFHFHHPAEERVNARGFAMVAHLVHKNAAGQLAVVAVLLDPGKINPLINTVWTYMPLDKGDSVRIPVDMVNLNELLPTDQRYYQFMGSLTTPPCSEGVLWMVLKQPTPIAREQIKLFSQLFPNNARPVQAANGRAVRSAQ